MKKERYITFRENQDTQINNDEYLQFLCRIIDSVIENEKTTDTDVVA